MEDKMKTRILILLTALGFSLGGCYTSFASREYEEDSFGQIEESQSLDNMNEQPDSMIVFQDENGNLDTVYLYTGNYTEVNDNPVEEVTIINNYYDDDVDDGFMVGGFFGFPAFYAPVPYYNSWYNPYFYDPFYCDYYPPYYGPTFYVYGDMYVGSGYYDIDPYYPSDERYRANQSHWTNLRNNDGGRKVSRKSRDSYRTLPVASRTSEIDILGKGINLDREMQRSSTSGRRTELASLNNGGIRQASYDITERELYKNRSREKTVSSRTSTKTNRRIVKREAIKQSKPKRTASKSKYTRQNTSRKRAYTEIQRKSSYSKRKNRSYRNSYNRSKQEVKGSSRRSTASRSYNRQRTSRSSGKSYSPSSSRSSYKSNSSRRSSSSYSGSRSSSRSKSYSSPSSRSSSRSSYSRPSTSRSSAPRSSAPRSSSSRSSRRR